MDINTSLVWTMAIGFMLFLLLLELLFSSIFLHFLTEIMQTKTLSQFYVRF